MMVRWPCRLAAAGAAASLADVAAVAPLGGGWLVTPSAVWPALAWFGLANMASSIYMRICDIGLPTIWPCFIFSKIRFCGLAPYGETLWAKKIITPGIYPAFTPNLRSTVDGVNAGYIYWFQVGSHPRIP